MSRGIISRPRRNLVTPYRPEDLRLITRWLDQSAGAKHAVQATIAKEPYCDDPARGGTGLNGMPTVRFFGGQGLVTPAIDLSGTAQATVACVFMHYGPGTQDRLIESGVAATSNDGILWYVNNKIGSGLFCNGSTATWVGNTFAYACSGWTAGVARYDTTQATPHALRRNTVDLVPGANVGTGTSGTFNNIVMNIGSQNNATGPVGALNGLMAELALIRRLPTPTELAALENYLMFKWGLGGTWSSWSPTALGADVVLWLMGDAGIETGALASTVDVEFSSGGTVPNLAPFASGASRSGADVVKSRGPWSGGVRVAQEGAGVASGVMGNTERIGGSMELWIAKTGLTAGPTYQFRTGTSGAAAVIGPMIGWHNDRIRYFSKTGGGETASYTWNPPPLFKPTHIVVTQPGVTPVLYIDGVQVAWSASSFATSQMVVTANAAWDVCGYSTQVSEAEVYSARHTPHVMTADQVRARYLLGARKCLLDARLHRDGSCPVSIGAQTSGKLGPWDIKSGTWKEYEDYPWGPYPGRRWLSPTAGAGVLALRSASAYGAWLVELQTAVTENAVYFSATTDDPATLQGYGLKWTAPSTIALVRRNAGADTVLATSAALTPLVLYRFWVTRRFDGVMNVWASDGSAPSLVLTATDTTYTSSTFMVARASAFLDCLGDVLSYLGEMTAAEAGARGIYP